MEIQYETLRLTRDAKGVLIVEFHSNRGPCTFSHTIARRWLMSFTGLRKIERTKS
jgi:hypothetical protein